MVAVSLALHLGLAVGIALSFFHTTPESLTASFRASKPPVMLLSSQLTPALLSPLPIADKPSTAHPDASVQPAPLSAPVQPAVEKALTAAAPPPLAPEANPNAHIQALPPETVLSPSPAPVLNSAEGVVFILDISGSMYEPYAGSNRLAFARETLSRRILALKDGTPFAITLYAMHARNSGPLVTASDATRAAAVRFIMRDVDCGGGTNLPAGLTSAQQLRPGFLILATDGDLNISAMNLASQARAILGPEGHCPVLAVIGIAPRSNVGAERLLQGLADQQGGTYGAEQIAHVDLVTSAANVTKPATATP
jgi:hypothetical protein